MLVHPSGAIASTSNGDLANKWDTATSSSAELLESEIPHMILMSLEDERIATLKLRSMASLSISKNSKVVGFA